MIDKLHNSGADCSSTCDEIGSTGPRKGVRYLSTRRNCSIGLIRLIASVSFPKGRLVMRGGPFRLQKRSRKCLKGGRRKLRGPASFHLARTRTSQ
jgi:hypothetical protein